MASGPFLARGRSLRNDINFSAFPKGNRAFPHKAQKKPLREFHCMAFLIRRIHMNAIIYLVGLIVIVLFILSFLGLR
jgi:hypothetical protein